MALVIIIPLIVIGIVGTAGYLIYRFLIYDMMCSRTVEKTLREYSIAKTQSQIVREYHHSRGNDMSEREARVMAKHYRQHEPDQFLAMYETTRDRLKSDKGE